MDRCIQLHSFRIVLFTFIFTVFILLLLLYSFFGFHFHCEQKKPDLFYNILDEEFSIDHTESYEYCFEKARTAEPVPEKWIVKPQACSNDVNVVVIVKSSTDRNENRRIIRKTWGRNVQLSNAEGKRLIFQTIFVIGIPSLQSASRINRYLQAENQKFKDILQIDVQDGYIVHHFLRKTLNGLRFVDKFCPNASIILITDDDTVFAPWLLFGQIAPVDDIIKNANLSFFGGIPFLMNIIPRQLSKTSRIRMPRDKYPCYSTPMYLQAFVMLISRKTMNQFLEEIPNYYSSIFLDDIYLSWLAYRLNITFTEFPKQAYDGSCLNDNSIKSHGQYEIHSKHDPIDEIAIFHQCDAPKMQTDLWRRLCQSFVINDTMVLKMHALYCDIWIEQILM